MDFEYLNIDEIDKNLEEDLAREKSKNRKILLIILIIFAIIFHTQITAFIKFSVAKPSFKDMTSINVASDPIQKNYTYRQSREKTFNYKSLINKNEMTIIPVAYYKLSGLVIAHNNNFILRSDFFDSAALYDIGVAWGEIGHKAYYNKDNISNVYSTKIELTGARALYLSWTEDLERRLPRTYLMSHYSHSHLVPANRNIMAALLKIRRWQTVEIEGELIDMRFTNKQGNIEKYYTSTVRDDSRNWNRGNGNCETIYVKRVKVNNRVYE